MNKINDTNQSLLQYDHDVQQQKKEERKRKKEEASQELADSRNDANNSNAEQNNHVGVEEDEHDDASFGGTDSGNIGDDVEHGASVKMERSQPSTNSILLILKATKGVKYLIFPCWSTSFTRQRSMPHNAKLH